MQNWRKLFAFTWLACVTAAPAQVITTVAGTDSLLQGPLPGLDAALGDLTGIAVDSTGNVYVADQDRNIVVKISPGGILEVVAGSGNKGFSGDGGRAVGASLNYPQAVALDFAGNLYIADTFNNRIRKVSNGIITTVAGNGHFGFSGDGGPATSATLNSPFGVAVDSAGNLYIGDDSFNAPRIRKVSNGIITTIAGDGTLGFSGDGGPAISAQFNFPRGMAVNAAGDLYIADSYNNRIRKVSNGIVTTVAGDGVGEFSGDGGPAASAQLDGPTGVALDAAGNVYIADTFNYRIREISGGIISTVAGSGFDFQFSGEGGPATSAVLRPVSGVALDAAGNLYIAEIGGALSEFMGSPGGHVRKVSGGILTTLAGNGMFGFSGDGGTATSAELNSPVGVAVDSAGNLYIADTDNQRVRKVANGIITTVAGNGTAGFSGDGGPATNAQLFFPKGLAVDGAGNLYIADTLNRRVRKVANGIITTVAGSGQGGFGGDGGPATGAALSFISDVAVDATGNLYFTDDDNNRVRKVTADGVITTVAGTDTAGYSGDGGPATGAELDSPEGVAVDAAGNLYVADRGNNAVRKVSGGIITTVAGGGFGFGDGISAIGAYLNFPSSVVLDAAGDLYISGLIPRVYKVSNGILTTVAGLGTSGFSGDGGPAVRAQLGIGMGDVALDPAGNLYVADTYNQRIRAVLSSPPSFQISSTTLSFAARSGGVAPGARTVNLTSIVPGLAYAVSSDAPWLSATPSSGSIPVPLQVSVDPSQLQAGAYAGNLTIYVPDALPQIQTVSVTFSVSPPAAGLLSLSTQSLPFSLTQGAAPATSQLTVSNAGSGAIRFTAAASGGDWLQVSPSAGAVSAGAPVPLTVTVIPGSMGVGTYSGAISVASPDTGQLLRVPVNLAISAPPQKILLSQTGLTFTAVAQGGAPLPQNFGILNAGQGSLSWSATATTLSGAGGWLSIDSESGTVTAPYTDVSLVNAAVDASRLDPGDYFGQIEVRAAGASNSPQSVSVALTVLPPGSNPGIELRPTSLIFTGASSGAQSVRLANLTAQSTDYRSVANGPLKVLPRDAAIRPNQPASVLIFPDFSNLDPGASQPGSVTFQFLDGSPPRTVQVLLVAPPAGASDAPARPGAPRGADACPSSLSPQFTQIGTGSTVPAGYPATVAAKIVDNCGAPMTKGSVTVSFSNGDPPIALTHLQDGNWVETWQPRSADISSVALTLKAQSGNLSAIRKSSVGVETSNALPILSGGPRSAATLAEGRLAPGELLLIQGAGMAERRAAASSAQQYDLGGASLVIGARLAPLLYADATQLLARVPPDVPINTSQQVLVQRGAIRGLAVEAVFSATHPAVLAADGSGQGQGLIYKAGAATTTLADASHPVRPGDTIMIYATGLGVTDQQGAVSHPAQVSIAGMPAEVSYAGEARQQDYPPAGAPQILGLVPATQGGLYEIVAVVPAGLANGAAPLAVTAGGEPSQGGITLAITGGAAVATPVVTSVNTAGGFPDIAQNAFIEIKGANLAPASVGGGVLWDDAPDFAFGRMPTQLGGASVTVNGKAAFVYFASPTQLNVLTPLDDATGQVQVVVTSQGAAGAPFAVNMRAAAPSLLKIGATRYVVATHADGALLGPDSLSSPGYNFTPAQPGETIVLYAVGFGLPAAALVNGSSTQSGELPVRPVIRIGGAEARVTFAGLIGPGLYQCNLVVPAGAAGGDNAIEVSYGGQTAPAGDLLSVRR